MRGVVRPRREGREGKSVVVGGREGSPATMISLLLSPNLLDACAVPTSSLVAVDVRHGLQGDDEGAEERGRVSARRDLPAAFVESLPCRCLTPHRARRRRRTPRAFRAIRRSRPRRSPGGRRLPCSAALPRWLGLRRAASRGSFILFSALSSFSAPKSFEEKKQTSPFPT